MDSEPLRLRLLWKWPQLPKKKIKRFLELGDEYRAKGDESMARHCYQRSLELARSIRAVYLLKKIEQRIS